MSKFLSFLAIIALSGLIFAAPALAQCLPGVPCVGETRDTSAMSSSRACDADFMNQITARASLEAQRETLTNQYLIKKPDSVLEYSCFDRQISNAATHLPKVFSTTDHFRDTEFVLTGGITTPRTVKMKVDMGEGHADNLFKEAILKPIKKFTDHNFGHNFLGDAVNQDYRLSGSIRAGEYGCAHMQKIWHVAKCDDAQTALFNDFDALVSNDPRIEVTSCGDSGIAQDVIALSRNEGGQYAAFDPVETHLASLEPPRSPFAPRCGTPFPTGVKFPMTVSSGEDVEGNIINDVRWFDELICPNPSCSFDRKNNQCVPDLPD